MFESLLERGRGIVLITGHYGNWEVGSLLIRSALDLPLTIVAMAEADPIVNRIRLEIREKLGADTIEVRQSLDTALQIRRCLADNRIVAMLVDRHFGKDRVAVTLFGRAGVAAPNAAADGAREPARPCFPAPSNASARAGSRPGPARPSMSPRTSRATRRLLAAAQQVADALAAQVREHPEFWYHFYRYWDAQRDDYGGLA